MTYAEALDYLHGLAVFGARFGLETTQRMAAGLGNPQEQLRFIHVAGTNGKGSTCAMLESVYRAAGLRVGLFTSPHLVSFRERMQVNRQLITEGDVARLVEEVISSQCLVVSQKGGGLASLSPQSLITNYSPHSPPTLFEFVTVMALRYFAEQRCDVVIWETGLGGRLDATNIVTPLASVITNIALDHQQWLGDTLAKIAREKAGIIKPGVPVLTATDAEEAVAAIRAEAERLGAPFTLVAGERGTGKRDKCQTGAAGTPAPLVLPLRGAHQRRNAALAVAVVAVLQDTLPVSEAALRRGLETVQWAGRLQVASVGGREFLLDGAHNLDGVHALVAALRGDFRDRPFALVLGMLGDKECELMCRTLAPLTRRIAAVRVKSNRSVEPAGLAEFCRRANPAALVTAHESVGDALAAVQEEPRVVIAGSLYLIGEALERLGLDAAAGERGLNEWQPAGRKS